MACALFPKVTGISNVISVPLPSSLLRRISPPIRRTSSREMDKPKPDPWCLRVNEVSAWTKGSKIASDNFLLIPIPVSVTDKTSRFWSYEIVTMINPVLVNLTELLSSDAAVYKVYLNKFINIRVQ